MEKNKFSSGILESRWVGSEKIYYLISSLLHFQLFHHSILFLTPGRHFITIYTVIESFLIIIIIVAVVKFIELFIKTKHDPVIMSPAFFPLSRPHPRRVVCLY